MCHRKLADARKHERSQVVTSLPNQGLLALVSSLLPVISRGSKECLAKGMRIDKMKEPPPRYTEILRSKLDPNFQLKLVQSLHFHL